MDEGANLGPRIKQLREYKNWTQGELAERAGVSRSVISEYERGIKQPSAVSLKKIADILMVPMDIFFEDSKTLPLHEIMGMFPKDVQEFLQSQDGLPYVEFSMRAKDLRITPELLNQMVDMIRFDRSNVEKERSAPK